MSRIRLEGLGFIGSRVNRGGSVFIGHTEKEDKVEGSGSPERGYGYIGYMR